MNLITNTWRQLIRRRLWPIALLLVAALVAVPMKLKKSPEPAAPVPAAAVAKAQQAEAESKPVVELQTASDTQAKKRRRVLGQAKDPFEPAPLPKKKKHKAKAAATATPAPAESNGGSSTGGGSSSAPPSSAPPANPPVPSVTFAKGSLKVRFGDTATTGDLPTLYINRLAPIPNTDTPILVFEGTRDNGDSALFSIPGDVSAVGDGKCDPSPQDCAELKLRAGQTEFITVKGAGQGGADAEFELDLVKIFGKATKVPKAELDASGAGAHN
jgi:hypothetical protein